MRLRQVALASRDLDGVQKALNTVFGLKVAYNDPHIDHYGLKNAVLPAGASFIEIVEPIVETASAARFLNRRGHDAGYMLILQVPDAAKAKDRIEGQGVRVVDEIDRPHYRCYHFHPSDMNGVLASVDEQRTVKDYMEPYADWMPAGPDWQKARTDVVSELAAVTLASDNPTATAKRWSDWLGRPLDPKDPLRLPLDRGEMRFAKGDTPGSVITAMELKTADPKAALERARGAGLDVSNEGVLIGGMRFQPVS